MNNRIPIIVLVLVLALDLSGQIPINPLLSPQEKKDLSSDRNLSEKILKDLENKSRSLQDDTILNSEIDRLRKSFSISRDKSYGTPNDIFPGSDRFYARSPYWIQPSDKSFIRKPDTSVKYYLIIKDPLSGAVTK